VVRRAALAGLLLAACAPDASDRVVTLEAVSAEARANRDAQLRGQAPRATPAAGPGALGDDATYTGGAVSAAAAPAVTGPVDPVAPRAVPQRPDGTGGNVVAFALATSHPVGQTVYPREGGSDERRDRACARYVSDDLAQQAFLEAGGPQEDTRGMDPDGDGYACGWDPERFRRAVD